MMIIRYTFNFFSLKLNISSYMFNDACKPFLVEYSNELIGNPFSRSMSCLYQCVGTQSSLIENHRLFVLFVKCMLQQIFEKALSTRHCMHKSLIKFGVMPTSCPIRQLIYSVVDTTFIKPVLH